MEIVNPGGEELRSQATLALDGTPGPTTGNYGADVAAMTMPAPGVLVMQLVDHGTPASTRVYSVSAAAVAVRATAQSLNDRAGRIEKLKSEIRKWTVSAPVGRTANN